MVAASTLLGQTQQWARSLDRLYDEMWAYAEFNERFSLAQGAIDDALTELRAIIADEQESIRKEKAK